jgi:hypothetical protein
MGFSSYGVGTDSEVTGEDWNGLERTGADILDEESA